MDLYIKFLQGDLNEEVYMQLPEGFNNQGEHKAFRLLNHYMGLNKHQRWNLKFTKALINGRYNQSKHDYSLFTKWRNGKIIILLVYVDDILIIGDDIEGTKDLKRYLNSKFRIKDHGALKYFPGIGNARSKSEISLNQGNMLLISFRVWFIYFQTIFYSNWTNAKVNYFRIWWKCQS